MIVKKRSLACFLLYAGLLVFCNFVSNYSYSQINFLKGRVISHDDRVGLSSAVISIINAKDSILRKFTRSDAKGNFSMPLPGNGSFQVIVSYPGYADFVDGLTITRDTAADAGDIVLIKKAELLDSVIVHQKIAAIRLKGDTIQYRVDSFLVRPGATVEDLLKRLPGIQVDRSGNITAQGQKVKKVLVDGEEFFGDDPAVVIQNLSADYVKDVQVFDKKSEQAEFSGIDDGKTARTINLKLKEDKKRGYFGSLKLAGGMGGKFQNSLMVNSFKGARKLSVFGLMANTNEYMLGGSDMQNFGGADDVIEYNEDVGFMSMAGGVDWEFNQDISNNGLPTTWSAGAHYSDKWNDKQKFNGDYRFMKRNTMSESSTKTQYILPDTQYFNSQTQKAFSSRIKNGLYGTYDLQLDSLTSVKFKVGASRDHNNGNSANSSRSLNADSALVNENSRTLNSDVVKDNAMFSALFRRKFLKTGRTLSVNLSEQINNESLNGFLRSNTDYYANGLMSSSEKIDQEKNNTSNASLFSGKVLYTEQLAKNITLGLNYGIAFTGNTIHRNSFNNEPGQGYKIKDSIYSNDFKYNYLVNSGGADLKIKTKKIIYNFGGSLSNSKFGQKDLVRDTLSNYSFINFYPRASIIYKPDMYKMFQGRYRGETKQPGAEQLQPVRQNNDPLNIQLGNPGLRQEFKHTFSVNYFDFKPSTSQNIMVMGTASMTTNAITSSSNMDAGGKTVYQSINLGTNASGYFTFLYTWKWKKANIELSTGFDLSADKTNSMVNGIAGVDNTSQYGVRTRMSKNIDNRFNFSLNVDPSFNISKSTLRTDMVTKYFSASVWGDAWVQLPLNIYVSSVISAEARQKISAFDAGQNSIKWDAKAAMKFAKNKKAEIGISVNDILNRNLSFTRNISSNFISENTVSVLKRYALLTFSYNLSKTP